jgi:hypothetical protein
MQAITLPITLPRWVKPAYYVVVGLLALVGVVAVVVLYRLRTFARVQHH